jgi:hypothetical protein
MGQNGRGGLLAWKCELVDRRRIRDCEISLGLSPRIGLLLDLVVACALLS